MRSRPGSRWKARSFRPSRAATKCASPASARSARSRKSTSSAPTDPAVHVGKSYTFRIIEYKDGGKNVVVSRRKQLEEAAARQRRRHTQVDRAWRGAHRPRGFGAGLRRLRGSWWRHPGPAARVRDELVARHHPNEVVAAGDQITVKVLRVDEATEKISLGLKQLQDDPWSTVATKLQVGQVRTGRVTRVADFGAFVELEPGIEGLAHASTFAPTGRLGAGRNRWPSARPRRSRSQYRSAQKRIGVALVEEGSSRARGSRARAGRASCPARS